ncbi:MAG: carbohydrate ABC transporter permease [Clostridium sp.]|jgi:multiple sugar transport system permease protein|nr:carbohydrate ABC transporter permease [Clostridium sp.]
MKSKRKKWRLFLVVLCFSLVWIGPLAVTVTNSFAPSLTGEAQETQAEEDGFLRLSFLPEKFSLEQYAAILIQTPVYLNMFWNSALITVAVAAGSVVVATLGAYGFTMLRFRGKELLFLVCIVGMLLPLQVTLMPNYLVAGFLGIEDSYLAIILPGIFHPFGVFLLRQQMKLLPWECVEAAKMDGAGQPQVFFYIVLPMVKSGIAALVMLLVIEYWNLIDQALIFIKETQKQPLSVFLARISMEASAFSFAAATFYIVPVLALLCYGHEYLKAGIGLMNAGEK